MNNKLPPLINPRLIIKKSLRQLQVFDGELLVKTYAVVLGFTPLGDKEREGDGRTPEGEFFIAAKNPESKFYRSLGLSYPNAKAAERGLRDNLISQSEYDKILRAMAENRLPPQDTALGGEIYLHGGGTEKDWTRGCVALRDDEIEDLFDAVPRGVPVTIES